jgi:prepilin-type N-terminal cleavage/methylation domain-containing protein
MSPVFGQRCQADTPRLAERRKCHESKAGMRLAQLPRMHTHRSHSRSTPLLRPAPAGLVRRRRRGFTLMEILVVITLIALLSTAVGVSVMDHLKSSKVRMAGIDAATVRQAAADSRPLVAKPAGRHVANDVRARQDSHEHVVVVRDGE